MTTSILAAPKPGDELKAEIEAKIQAKGVAFTHWNVTNDEVHDQNMVVGMRENGTKKSFIRRMTPDIGNSANHQLFGQPLSCALYSRA